MFISQWHYALDEISEVTELKNLIIFNVVESVTLFSDTSSKTCL